MTTLENNKQLFPFPTCGRSKEEQLLANELYLRPFGVNAEDLTIDFQNTPRPWLETQVLACCTLDKAGNKLADDFFWNLDLSKRTECLLAVTSLLKSSQQFDVDLRCRNPECLEDLEVEFTMQDIAHIQGLAETHQSIEVEINNKLLSLRKPKGSDQLKWLSGSYPDESAATQYMINTLLPEDQQLTLHQQDKQNNEWLETINDAMVEMDPLVNFHLKTSCPCCEKKDDYDIDFGEICLQELRAAQNRLIETVHTLAFHYHWNDQEIFALPNWRLQRHLRLVEREVEG